MNTITNTKSNKSVENIINTITNTTTNMITNTKSNDSVIFHHNNIKWQHNMGMAIAHVCALTTVANAHRWPKWDYHVG